MTLVTAITFAIDFQDAVDIIEVFWEAIVWHTQNAWNYFNRQ